MCDSSGLGTGCPASHVYGLFLFLIVTFYFMYFETMPPGSFQCTIFVPPWNGPVCRCALWLIISLVGSQGSHSRGFCLGFSRASISGAAFSLTAGLRKVCLCWRAFPVSVIGGLHAMGYEYVEVRFTVLHLCFIPLSCLSPFSFFCCILVWSILCSLWALVFRCPSSLSWEWLPGYHKCTLTVLSTLWVLSPLSEQSKDLKTGWPPFPSHLPGLLGTP